MKKRITILTLSLLLATAVQAQIYVMENEANQREGVEVPNNDWPDNPQVYNQGNDDYAPLGSGVLLLTALGGAYLLIKKGKIIDNQEYNNKKLNTNSNENI